MAALDLLSTDEALSALARGAAAVTDADAIPLAAIITAASIRLDQLIGASVIRTVTAEVHTARRPSILLRSWPVVSIDTVTEDDVELAATDTKLESEWGVLRRVSGTSLSDWTTSPGGVVVTYDAGRVDSTAEVDARIKTAAQIVVRHMWEQDRTLGAALLDQSIQITTPRSYSVPKRALELVRDLIRPTYF